MVDLADLAGWTPVSLVPGRPAPSIHWGDLRGLRFAEPFFDQTVERWAAGAGVESLAATDLDGLMALDAEPSLDPSVLIFHLSRCGSTLVSRLLSTLPGALVVAEPQPINALLSIAPYEVEEDAVVGVLRLLVRALGRRRFGDERHYILKLSSWNVRRLSLFLKAFPGVPVVWVQRAPLQVIASLLADPPGWGRIRQSPEQAEWLFGISPQDLASLDEAAFYARALGAMLGAARDVSAPLLPIDYAELPDGIWDRLVPWLCLDLDEADNARMAEEARFDAKDPNRRLFAGARSRDVALSSEVRAIVDQDLEPLYRALRAPRSGP